MQIKNFNNKTNFFFSKENPISLKQFFEKSINVKDPLNFVFTSEFLYLNYKYEMIEKLSTKYRINDKGEFTLEKQFINLDLFYKKSQEGDDPTVLR